MHVFVMIYIECIFLNQPFITSIVVLMQILSCYCLLIITFISAFFVDAVYFLSYP